MLEGGPILPIEILGVVIASSAKIGCPPPPVLFREFIFRRLSGTTPARVQQSTGCVEHLPHGFIQLYQLPIILLNLKYKMRLVSIILGTLLHVVVPYSTLYYTLYIFIIHYTLYTNFIKAEHAYQNKRRS